MNEGAVEGRGSGAALRSLVSGTALDPEWVIDPKHAYGICITISKVALWKTDRK
jgi:hypothetical protein